MSAARAAGLEASFGFGDRLGIATPGHIAAMRAAGSRLVPVFAQQSARELQRTGRSWRDVMDAARGAVEAADWERPWAADADHCKEVADVAGARACGYTIFTLDPSDHIGEAEASNDARAVERRWLAVVEHVAMLAAEVPREADIEVSIDETTEPTTPAEHAFVASELRRRGVRLTSLAPRFPGDFEKGVDHRGSLADFVDAVRAHAHVAREHGPYKLSLHSGSDKLRLYRPLAQETRGLFHVKTAGTSYLEALRVAGKVDPQLLREIWARAAERFDVDRATYATTAAVAAVPAEIVEAEPAHLLDDAHARRILHVTFGSVLSDRGLEGRLSESLAADDGASYRAALEHHLSAHLEALAA